MTPEREQLIREIHTTYTRVDGSLNGKLLASQKSEDFRRRLEINTPELDDSYTPAARIAFVLEDRNEPPVCEKCGDAVKYSKQTQSFNRFCSMKCSTTADTTLNKKETTCVERYGYANPLSNPVIQELTKATNRERYGVDKPFQSKEIQQKVLNTVAAMGVVSTALLPEVRARQKATNRERYGVDKPFQSKEIQTKVTSTMFDEYGVQRWSMSHIPQASYDTLADREAIRSMHFDQHMPLNQIGEVLGVSWTTVKKYFTEHGFGEPLHFYSSAGEREVVEYIKSLSIDDVQTNVRSIIHPKELDIYIPSHSLAIEYCGLYWHSETQGKTRHYHRSKFLACRKKGIRLITMFDSEWILNKDLVKAKLASILQCDSSPRTYARKCNVVELSTIDKHNFFQTNHIQGNGPGSISYGLTYGGETVAAVTFIDEGKNRYVLNRYASRGRVVGGFSKLLAHFINQHPQWSEITTFADLRWSVGDLYFKTGFRLVYESDADYMYINQGKPLHKRAFAPHQLPSKLPNYNPDLSEWENMQAHGLDRIWDCGKMRFAKVNRIPEE